MNAQSVQLKCQCGEFELVLKNFPHHTPGRMVCYCDDCQTFLHAMGREDLLDENGGSEVIPLYPADVEILKGAENLKVMRLSPKGMYRFFVSCCNTPVANTEPGRAWLGTHRAMFQHTLGDRIEILLGPVRARIMGRFARGTPPPRTADKMSLRAIWSVLPFMLRGEIKKWGARSPFFKQRVSKNEAWECVSPASTLSLEERIKIRQNL